MSADVLRLATWNVNSIRARVDRVVDWLQRGDVDVLAMQETKCADDQFPTMPFLEAGYEVVHCGFNQWNGVAIASRVGLDDVQVGFEGQPSWGKDGAEAKAEARALAATSGLLLQVGWPSKPTWTSSRPTRDAIATPFHWL